MNTVCKSIDDGFDDVDIEYDYINSDGDGVRECALMMVGTATIQDCSISRVYIVGSILIVIVGSCVYCIGRFCILYYQNVNN